MTDLGSGVEIGADVTEQLDRLDKMLADSRAFSTGMLELTIPNEMYINANNKLASAFGKIQ